MAQSAQDNPLILYDGICNLCTGSVIFVIRRDSKKRFRFAAMQSPLGQKLLETYGLSRDPFETFVLVTQHGHYTKSTAVLEVIRQIEGPWRLFAILGIIPRPIRDLVYDWIARNRFRLFGKKDSCLVPTEDIRDRFIDPD